MLPPADDRTPFMEQMITGVLVCVAAIIAVPTFLALLAVGGAVALVRWLSSLIAPTGREDIA